ncbi:PQQ-dependent sugar dehydrogenase [Parashewanella tropica]|uniref:PQQ-dependent sugar dehydrogenase n=1 Tax=Parashewanella tropica TaxID=2547970 RepID=UPI00105A3D8D|nr:PQQ-dependent sugar dehydrogenase [Parashewanella tropica]
MLKPFTLALLSTLAFSSQAVDYEQLKFIPVQANVVTITDDVNVPWGMVQLPNQDILVTERSGELKLIKKGNDKAIKISGLPKITARGQGGLLDVALHPDFDKNQLIYLTLSSPEGKRKGSNTALIQARLNSEKRQIENIKTLFKAKRNTTSSRHFGSRITFDNNGYLYFSVGDRANRDVNPQNLTKDAGKIYRLHLDGSIPKDNPFINQKDVSPAIFSYGHRNPQGLALNPVTGSIWSHEHGPRGGDEINLIKKGLNYGWPVVSYGINYIGTKFTNLTAKEGMEPPLSQWTPSIAPSDMVFVTSDKYPKLKGKLLVGSLKYGFVSVVSYQGDKVISQAKAFKDIGRLRSLMQGNDGYLYVGVDGKGILQLQPTK